jgi:hypothetical protein
MSTTIEPPSLTPNPTGGLLQQHDTFNGHNSNAATSTCGDPLGLSDLATLLLFLYALWSNRGGRLDKDEKQQGQHDLKESSKRRSIIEQSDAEIAEPGGHFGE